MAKRMFKIETECRRKNIYEIFDSFIIAKQAEGMAQSTIKLYFYEFNHFIRWVWLSFISP